jgi:hypothetical protein
MSPKQWDLGEYVDVNERLKWFFERYPEGSLQSEVTHLADNLIIVKAMAYRGPTDLYPGVGHASEVVPGRTPYTKDSELMNAESSAWGRALAAIGAPTKGHVASGDEIRGADARRQKKSGGAQTGSATEPDGAQETPAPTGPPPALPPDHKHTWTQSPTLKSFVVCSDPACRKVQKKEDANA